MDWGSLVDSVKTQVSQAADNYVKVGVPALEASVEQSAINWLSDQKAQTQQTLNQNVAEVAAQKSDPNSLGAQLAGVFQTTALNNYGLYIVGAVVAILVVGAVLRK